MLNRLSHPGTPQIFTIRTRGEAGEGTWPGGGGCDVSPDPPSEKAGVDSWSVPVRGS